MSLCRANLAKVFADIVGTIPSVLVAFWYPNDTLGTFRAGSGAANLDLEKVVRPNHLLLTLPYHVDLYILSVVTFSIHIFGAVLSAEFRRRLRRFILRRVCKAH